MASKRRNLLQDSPGDSLMSMLTGVISVELPDLSTFNSPPSVRDPLAGFSADSPQFPGQKSLFGPQFPLMQLPKELRMMVYAEHFGYGIFQANRSFSDEPVLNGLTGILRASKHVYAEARVSLFRNREIEFHGIEDMTRLCKEIGQHNFNLIRHVRVFAIADSWVSLYNDMTLFPMFDTLVNSAPGLRYLTLFGISVFEQTDCSYLNIFDDPAAFSRKIWKRFLEALSKMKHLRRLQVIAKPGNVRVARLAAALGQEVEIRLS